MARITGRASGVRKLSTPDAAGNTHRVTVALDSQIAEHATSALSPVENDILNGTRFALAPARQ